MASKIKKKLEYFTKDLHQKTFLLCIVKIPFILKIWIISQIDALLSIDKYMVLQVIKSSCRSASGSRQPSELFGGHYRRTGSHHRQLGLIPQSMELTAPPPPLLLQSRLHAT